MYSYRLTAPQGRLKCKHILNIQVHWVYGSNVWRAQTQQQQGVLPPEQVNSTAQPLQKSSLLTLSPVNKQPTALACTFTSVRIRGDLMGEQ